MFAIGPHSIAGDDDDIYGIDDRGRQQQQPRNNNGGLVAYDLEADEMSDQVMPQQSLHQLHHQKIRSLNRRQQKQQLQQYHQQQQQQQQHPYYPSGSMNKLSYDPQQQQPPRNYYQRPQQYGTGGRRRSSTDRRSSGPTNADFTTNPIPQYRQYRHTLQRPSTSNSDRRLSIDAGSQPTQYNPYVMENISPSRLSHSRSNDPELRTALKQINSWFDFDNYDEKQQRKQQQQQQHPPPPPAFDPRVLVNMNNDDYDDTSDGGVGALRMPARTVLTQQRSRASIAAPTHTMDPSVYRPLSDYAANKLNTHQLAGLHGSRSGANIVSGQLSLQRRQQKNNSNKRLNGGGGGGLRHNTASRSSLSSAYSIGSRGSRPSHVTADGTVTGPGTSTTSLNQSASLQRNIQHQHQRSLNAAQLLQQQQFQRATSTLPNHYINNRPLPKRPLGNQPLPDPPPLPGSRSATALRSVRTNSRLAGAGVGMLPGGVLSNRSTTGDGASTATTTARQQSMSANSDSPELLKSASGGALVVPGRSTARRNAQSNFTFIRYRGRKCTTVMLIAFVILVILLTVTPIVYFTSTALRQNNAKKSLTLPPSSSSLLSDAFVPITDTGGGLDGTLIDPGDGDGGGGSTRSRPSTNEIANITGKLTLLTNIGPLDKVLSNPSLNPEQRTGELMERLQTFMVDILMQADAFVQSDIQDISLTADERVFEHELDVHFSIRMKRSLPASDVEPRIKRAFAMSVHEDADTHIASLAQLPFRKGTLRYSMVPRSKSSENNDGIASDGNDMDGFAVGSANDRVPPAPPPSTSPPTTAENVEHAATTQQQPLHVKTASFTIKPMMTTDQQSAAAHNIHRQHTQETESSTAPATLRPSLKYNAPFGHTQPVGNGGKPRVTTTSASSSRAVTPSSAARLPFTPGGKISPYKPTVPTMPTTPASSFAPHSAMTNSNNQQSEDEFSPQRTESLAAAPNLKKPVTIPGIAPYKPTPPTLPSPTTPAPQSSPKSVTSPNFDDSTQEVLHFKWNKNKDTASEPTFPPLTPPAETTTTTTTTTTPAPPVSTTLFITQRKPHVVTPLPHMAVSTFAPSDVAAWQKQPSFLPSFPTFSLSTTAAPTTAATITTTFAPTTTTSTTTTTTTAATTTTTTTVQPTSTTTTTTTTAAAPAAAPTESAASVRLSNTLTTRSSNPNFLITTPYYNVSNSVQRPFSPLPSAPTTAFPYTAVDELRPNSPLTQQFMTTTPANSKLLWTIPTTTTAKSPVPAADLHFYQQRPQNHHFVAPFTTTTAARPFEPQNFFPNSKPFSESTTSRSRPPPPPPAPNTPPPRWVSPHVLSVPVLPPQVRPLRPLLFNATLTVGNGENLPRFPTNQRPSDVAVPDQPWQFGLTSTTRQQHTDPASFYSWLSTRFPNQQPPNSGTSFGQPPPLTTSSYFMSTTKPANFYQQQQQQPSGTFGMGGGPLRPLTATRAQAELASFTATTTTPRPIVHESKTHASEPYTYAWSQWSDWGSCSAVPCNPNGFQTRTRICRSWFGMGPPLPEGDGPCLSQNTDISSAGAVEARPCVCDMDENLAAAGNARGGDLPVTAEALSTRDSTTRGVAGVQPEATQSTTAEWSAWSSWSSCFSQPCSPYSTQFRQRKCLDTNTRSEISGLLCRRQGDNSPESMANTETRYCICPTESSGGGGGGGPAAVVAVVGDNFDVSNTRRQSFSKPNVGGEEESRRNQPPTLDVNPNKCRDSERQCKSGECIPSFQYCDGFSDCADGSDEPAGCATCFSGEFKCRNGRCISSSSMCDGLDHCGDQSDEHFCSR